MTQPVNLNRVRKQKARQEKTISSPTPSQLKKLRKIEQNNSLESSYDIVSLKEGMNVEHARFGKGIIQSIEGKTNDL